MAVGFFNVVGARESHPLRGEACREINRHSRNDRRRHDPNQYALQFPAELQ